MTAVFTGVQVGPSDYYKTRDEQAVAIAEAMREEYRAIVDAGLNVQIDDPIARERLRDGRTRSAAISRASGAGPRGTSSS